MYKIIRYAGLFICLAGLSVQAQAFTAVYNFTGECDDCAFVGDPTDPGFNPIGDGLTETVTGQLIVDGLNINSSTGMIEYLGTGFVSFHYDGSSLINPFTIGSPYLFSSMTSGLLPSGEVVGDEFHYHSTQNLADPYNPVSFNFPDFYTPLGLQVFGYSGTCEEGPCPAPWIGDIAFALDTAGNWSITGMMPSDIGINGQLTPAAVPLPGALIMFASGMFGLLGAARRRLS